MAADRDSAGDVPAAHHVGAAIAGWVTFSVYVAGLAPSAYWLDSSEFAAAAFELGVAHPPGHPLAVLLGKGCALVPIGSIAFRVGLASAIAASLAVVCLALIASEVAHRVGRALAGISSAPASARLSWSPRRSWLEASLGAGAGVGFGLCYALAFQAVRPEVYALNALLVLAAVLQLLRFDRERSPKYLRGAALLIGLALTNHHLLGATFAIGGVLYLALRGLGESRSKRTRLGWLAIATLLPLATYLYLPLRAARNPEVNWGAASSWSRFLWTISARAFQKSVAHAGVDSSTGLVAAVAAELVWIAPLAALGLYLLARLRATRPIGLLLAGPAAIDLIATAAVGFQPDNPDGHGYFAPALALFFAAAAAVPIAVYHFSRGWFAHSRVGEAVLCGVAGALLLAPGLLGGSLLRLHRFYDLSEFVAAILAEAPPRAALVTSNFQTAFALWYARGVEGQRPDIDHVHRHFLAYPGYHDTVLKRHPALAESLGRRDLQRWRTLARSRAVLLEYDLDVDREIAMMLQPIGFIGRVIPDGESPQPRHQPLLDAMLGRFDLREPQTLRVVYWFSFLDGVRACLASDFAGAVHSIERARKLLGAGRDLELENLAERCQAQGTVHPRR